MIGQIISVSWKKTKLFVTKFEDAYARLSNRIETANNWNKQLAWKSYRKYYLQVVRNTKSALRSLKKELKNNSELLEILKQLENSMKNIFDVN